MKRFVFDFDDEGPNSICYEVPENARLYSSMHDGTPFVFANRAAMLALAKVLIQVAEGGKKDGFHVHLREDFGDDASKPDVLTLVLDETGK